ncbi:MAG: hypothetical protein PF448_06280 [Bacteroidales bacterium]|jgi:hypothetical protein|nr:hypothetical protein [Bacteroidales bacterium]
MKTTEIIINLLRMQTAPIKNSEIRKYLKENHNIETSSVQIRQFIHQIRILIEPKLISNNRGYYISNNSEETLKYINSLEGRANSMLTVANSMRKSLFSKQQMELNF